MRALGVVFAIVALVSFVMPPSFADDLTVTVVSMTSTVKHGQRATLVVKTQPGATCEGYISSGGKGGIEEGHLASRQVGANGQITWSWPTAGKAGQRTVHVDCKNGAQTASVDAPFAVE